MAQHPNQRALTSVAIDGGFVAYFDGRIPTLRHWDLLRAAVDRRSGGSVQVDTTRGRPCDRHRVRWHSSVEDWGVDVCKTITVAAAASVATMSGRVNSWSPASRRFAYVAYPIDRAT